MDPVHFDYVAKLLSTAGTRRALMRLLTAVPVAGTLAVLFGAEPPPAAGSGAIVGSGHRRRHPRKAHHRHEHSDHERNEHKGKHKGNGNGNGNGDTTPSNPCAGKANGSCCAGAAGGQWCQGGACEAVPLTGTITECQGACGPREVTVCGATMTCPDCIRCRGCYDYCDVFSGPFDTGRYCVKLIEAVGCGSCTSPNQCCGDDYCAGLCVP